MKGERVWDQSSPRNVNSQWWQNGNCNGRGRTQNAHETQSNKFLEESWGSMIALCYLWVKTCRSANCMLVEEEKQKLNLQFLSLKTMIKCTKSASNVNQKQILLSTVFVNILTPRDHRGGILLTKCRQRLWLYCTNLADCTGIGSPTTVCILGGMSWVTRWLLGSDCWLVPS